MVLLILVCQGRIIAQQTMADTLRTDQSPALQDTNWYATGDMNLNLLMAADTDDIKAALYVLNRGANINAVTEEGATPLMYASQKGFLDMVKLLVLNGADVTACDYKGESALVAAAKFDREDIADFLVQQGAPIDSCSRDGETALMHAVAGGFNILTDMLLYYGANPLRRDQHGNDALMISAYQNFPDMASILLFNGANANCTDNDGNTPLMIAAQKGFDEMADTLLHWGANVENKNKNGYTALAMAIQNGNQDAVKLLLLNKARVNESIRPGVRPLDLVPKGNTAMDSLLRNSGASRSSFPDYSRLIIGGNLSFNFHDYSNGIFTGLYDSKYASTISVGFMSRISARSVLVMQDEINGHQYWERRYLLWAGIEKQFSLFRGKNDSRSGFFAGLKEGFSFGGYRGSNSHAESRWMLIPSAGVSRTGRVLNASLGYEYAPYPNYSLSPSRIVLSFGFHFPVRNESRNIKTINWLYP